MSYISWNALFPLTISSNLTESIVENQLYAGKVNCNILLSTCTIYVFNFSQIQDARNCSKQSVYVFCSNRMMRKFALYKRVCCCKQVVEEFSHLVCYKKNVFSKRKTNIRVKCCLNLQFRENIRRIQICLLIFFQTETSGTRGSFCLVVFPGRIVNSVTLHAWGVAIWLLFTPPRHSSFCLVHAIGRIVQWEENSEMRLAYFHLFVLRGRRSNTDIWFLIQEAQNIAVYGDKCWERWNFSGV